MILIEVIGINSAEKKTVKRKRNPIYPCDTSERNPKLCPTHTQNNKETRF